VAPPGRTGQLSLQGAVTHQTTLVATIAVGLAVAFLVGFAAARLGLPALVGYVVAGVEMRPTTPATDAEAVVRESGDKLRSVASRRSRLGRGS
jgi:hypothetical protein